MYIQRRWIFWVLLLISSVAGAQENPRGVDVGSTPDHPPTNTATTTQAPSWERGDISHLRGGGLMGVQATQGMVTPFVGIQGALFSQRLRQHHAWDLEGAALIGSWFANNRGQIPFSFNIRTQFMIGGILGRGVCRGYLPAGFMLHAQGSYADIQNPHPRGTDIPSERFFMGARTEPGLICSNGHMTVIASAVGSIGYLEYAFGGRLRFLLDDRLRNQVFVVTEVLQHNTFSNTVSAATEASVGTHLAVVPGHVWVGMNFQILRVSPRVLRYTDFIGAGNEIPASCLGRSVCATPEQTAVTVQGVLTVR